MVTKKAELVYNTMIYSMGKWTAMMAGALKGKVDAILLTGGMARDTELCDKLAEYISWIAPIYNYAGSFETEALGFGAIRVLKGEEEAKTYTGNLYGMVFMGQVNLQSNGEMSPAFMSGE